MEGEKGKKGEREEENKENSEEAYPYGQKWKYLFLHVSETEKRK